MKIRVKHETEPSYSTTLSYRSHKENVSQSEEKKKEAKHLENIE